MFEHAWLVQSIETHGVIVIVLWSGMIWITKLWMACIKLLYLPSGNHLNHSAWMMLIDFLYDTCLINVAGQLRRCHTWAMSPSTWDEYCAAPTKRREETIYSRNWTLVTLVHAPLINQIHYDIILLDTCTVQLLPSNICTSDYVLHLLLLILLGVAGMFSTGVFHYIDIHTVHWCLSPYFTHRWQAGHW